MASEKPTWINTCYVTNILQKAKNDDSIKICNITVKPATAKGDNYFSDMYRVGVEFSWIQDGHKILEKGSFVAKIAPIGRAELEWVISSGMYELEISMVSDTLPRMNRMITELGMRPLSPWCFHVERENPIHLLFEDLAIKGFRMADRQAGLDLKHCLLAFRNLGRFHASSVALRDEDPKGLTKYTMGMFHKDQVPMMEKYITAGVKALGNETRNWNELNPRISEKLSKLSEVVYEKGCEIVRYREDEFNVLNHGDFWSNNILFRYDDLQIPIENIFVDFQLSHYGSPVEDLLNFFGTSPSDDVRIHHRELLLREYHNSLTDTMAKLKCNTKAMNFDDLQEILKRRALFEAIMTFTTLPVTLLDKSEAMELNELLSDIDGEYDNPAYRGRKYREIMTRLLPLYDGMGLLDT